MSLFDIETMETNLNKLEQETQKEEFWKEEISKTGKTLAKIKQLKKVVEQYKNTEKEIINLIE